MTQENIQWESLCHESEIGEGEARGFELHNKYIFAVKKDGRLYVYYNYCPHLGTPLEWQEHQFLDNSGTLIQCSTHGALFRMEDGHCLAGPCKGKNLKTIRHTIGNGFLAVDSQQVASLGRI